ncbi:MAG: hypothetical protein M1830_001734 [Pleopsidium flavum]|nr:MAG: hypothetical protein M1830_001734 [Pleopsidium flavum]
MSLRTGTELITLSLLLNKVSGFYGLLAILTGLHLSPLQLSMYIYSLLALVFTAFLAPHIRKQSPVECLALAWFYVLDTIVNAAYTAAFSVTWFLVISQHHSDAQGAKAPGVGGSTIDDTAGFTSPKYNVSHVEIAASPAAGLTPGQDGVAIGIPGASTSAPGPSLGHGFAQSESVSSILVICALWAIRVYFALIVLSYARFVLRQHIAEVSSRSNIHLQHKGGSSDKLVEDPFALHFPKGQGWQGRAGRAMVRVGRSYWLGTDEDDSWIKGVGGKFRKSKEGNGWESGPLERERRRRSGTGPPPLMQPVPQPLRVHELQEVR